MRRRLLLIVLVLLLGIAVCGPMFETVDHWDRFPQSGNDIVLTVLGVGICLGLPLTALRPLVTVFATGLVTYRISLPMLALFGYLVASPVPSSTAQSPPLALRI